ncbi:MAG: DEAD/DEAH box helicase, partial [Pseudomonadota bacterium]
MKTEFEIAAPLAEALANKGYETLTPVQEAVLDPALFGRDLLVSAQTGSGKTVAFGLALASSILQQAPRLPEAEYPAALIVAPTRELALQVTKELQWLYAPAGGRVVSCIGGVDIRDERRALAKGAHLVVGTPGRLVDHIRRASLDLSQLKSVVLDEADEMMDMGFREELEYILDAAPEDRQTLMFSATVSKPIARLAETYQNDAKRLNTISTQSAHSDIAYQAMTVIPSDVEKAVINTLLFH